MERLAELGVTAGCDTDPVRFCPYDPVTRGQTASFLHRAFNLDPGRLSGFTDTAGSVHAKAIEAVAAAGITRGCAIAPARYCPGSDTTKAQMAAMLARALEVTPRIPVFSIG